MKPSCDRNPKTLLRRGEGRKGKKRERGIVVAQADRDVRDASVISGRFGPVWGQARPVSSMA